MASWKFTPKIKRKFDNFYGTYNVVPFIFYSFSSMKLDVIYNGTIFSGAMGDKLPC